MGRGRRGPARAGEWPGTRGRDVNVVRGGGWRRDAEGETMPNLGHPQYSCSAWLVALLSARAANVYAYARPAVQTCMWPSFLKALLLAIACGLSALWARARVCCGPIAPRGPTAAQCPKSLMGPRVGPECMKCIKLKCIKSKFMLPYCPKVS